MLILEDVLIAQGDFTLRADLQVPRGARVAILGPSGAGKSTLLAAIGGFIQPERGRILWGDSNITGTGPAARPVATIFQDNNLFPHLTAGQNVGLGLRPNGRLTADDQSRVAQGLADVGLAGLEARKPGSLSGGQQSRVALARAAMQQKPVLLLDEAFSALGPALKSEMIGLVLRLCDAADLTLMMITHDPDEARALQGQTIVVADGMAHPPQDTESLLNDPPETLRAYLAP